MSWPTCGRSARRALAVIGLALVAPACVDGMSTNETPSATAVVAGSSSMQTLTSHTAVRAALAFIARNRAVGLSELVELTEIPAPPYGETERGRHFARMLRETGFGPVHIDEVGNVIARRNGRSGTATVAVLAHMDTVFPAGTDVRVRVEGDRYTAPGVGDNTRGLVLLLELARAIVAHDLQTDANLWLIGDVGEEGLGDLRGVRHLLRPGAPPIDAMIAIDGGQLGRIIYGAVGSERYRVTYRGPGGHSWGAFGLANPHHALGRAITHFATRAAPLTAQGEKSAFNVGRIGGGTSVNSIPFESWMEVDMRSGDPRRLALLTEAFAAAMHAALADENAARLRGAELEIDIQSIGSRPGGLGDPEDPLVQHAMAALGYLGVEPSLAISSTDANIPIALGIPAITLSRGGVSRRAHSLDEYWEDRDTHLATQLVLLTLLAQSGLRAD